MPRATPYPWFACAGRACQHGRVNPDLTTLDTVLADTESLIRRGQAASARVWPTGFDPLDVYLSGGLRAGELTLLGGPQGLGKTTFALQVARNVAAGGGDVVYFSFEHDPETMLERLLAIEAAECLGGDGMTLRQIREALERKEAEPAGLAGRLRMLPGGPEAVAGIEAFAHRIHLHTSNGRSTTTDAISEWVLDMRQSGSRPVVIVDYLQKVPDTRGSDLEEERVARVVAGLKDLALTVESPVFAIAASEPEGITGGKRMRIQHLRGTSALAYEADVVLIVNDKYDVVARHHLVYNTTNSARFRDYVVVSIEKNRSGLDRIDIEFRKRFEQGRFERVGRPVAEQLVDERVYVE